MFKQSTAAKALLGAAILGVSLLGSTVKAHAESLSFCFVNFNENSQSCEEVFYSNCGTSFHELYKFVGGAAGNVQFAQGMNCCNTNCRTIAGSTNHCTPVREIDNNVTCGKVFFEVQSNHAVNNTCFGNDKLSGCTCCEPGNSATFTCGKIKGEFEFVNFSGACGASALVNINENNATQTSAGQFDIRDIRQTPEPSTYVGLFGGLGLLWAARKRKSA